MSGTSIAAATAHWKYDAPPTDLKHCPHVFLHNCLDFFLPSTNSVSFRFGYLFWSQSQSHLLFFSVSISFPPPFRSTTSERDGFDILNLTKRKIAVEDTRYELNDGTQVKRREPKKTQKRRHFDVRLRITRTGIDSDASVRV